MHYDFETMTDRSQVGSEKWAAMYRVNPTVPAGIVPFSMADMEFKAADEIVQAMKAYADTYPLGYNCPTPGYLKAVHDWILRRHGWNIEKEWILPIPGVLVGLYAAIQELTEPGDGVIYCSPVFALFRSGIIGNHRVPVPTSLLEQEGGWQVDFDDLERKASDPNNKVLIFCNPHNPLGRIWSREELLRIGEICIKHQVLILSDEIHSDLIMPNNTHTSFGGLHPDIDKQLIVGTSPTKTFNLAGTQVGNLIIPNSELKQSVKLRLIHNGIFTVSAMGFVACEAAYNHCEDWLDECILQVYDNHLAVKQYVSEHISGLTVCDMHSTYLQWLDFRKLCKEPEELKHKLCFEANVFLDLGDEFGPEGVGFARMNLACSKSLILDAMERICKVF